VRCLLLFFLFLKNLPSRDVSWPGSKQRKCDVCDAKQEGSLSRNPSLRNLCPSPARNKSDASQRRISQWFVEVDSGEASHNGSSSPTGINSSSRATGSHPSSRAGSPTASLVILSRCHSRSGIGSGSNSPVYRGSPAGSRGLRVEPVISPVHDITNSDVGRHLNAAAPVGPVAPLTPYNCQKDDLRPENEHNPRLGATLPTEGSRSPHYGCSDTQRLSQETGSSGRARAAASMGTRVRRVGPETTL
jgi:hypothetical protein